MGLGGNSRKIFEFKGLIRKIFRNKDLGSFLWPKFPFWDCFLGDDTSPFAANLYVKELLTDRVARLLVPSLETGRLLASPI